MANITVGSSNSGQRITVNSLLKDPKVIPRRIVRTTGQTFIVDDILRDAGDAPGGMVVYYESTPLYVADQVLIVAEFGEIPATLGQMGQPRVVRTVKRALALKVSMEMRTRNKVDAVNMQVDQIRNTMRRSWEDAFLTTILGGIVNTLAATTVWSSASSKIRTDLAQAEYLVKNADADSNNGTGTQKFEFQPDTLIINTKTAADFKSSDDVAKPFIGSNIAGQNPQVRGELSSNFFGFRVIQSWRLPLGQAVLLQSKVVGGYVDEYPMQATEMYEDKPRQTWRTDVFRSSAMFLDQPKAACLITGV